MKLSYRDRIILIFVSLIAIVLIGIFLGIKPLSKDIKTNRAELEKQEKVMAEIQKEIDKIPGLEKAIDKFYTESVDIAGKFTEPRTPNELDKFLQPTIQKEFFEVDSTFTPGEAGVVNLEYYYVTPNILTYPLAEAADLDGSLSKKAAEEMKKTIILSTRTVEGVAGSTVELNFRAKKEDIMQFINDIKALDETIIIKSVVIDDYTFGAESENPEDVEYTTGTITIDFYSVQQIVKPNIGS
ncbi:MAG TPA: type II secretion system protein M [Clostridiales bacterium]|nr:type II secretion system protein M [Clostridiales bacterium]